MKVLVHYLKSIFFGIPQGIFMLTKSVPSNLNQTKTKQNRKTILHVRLTDSNTKHWDFHNTSCLPPKSFAKALFPISFGIYNPPKRT